MKLRLILRIVVIQKILFKHDLDILLWKLILSPIYHILRIIPRKRNNDFLGIRVRKALEELGPIFVKFGQILSTRRDILPSDIIDELAKLQDNVPPFSPEKAIIKKTGHFHCPKFPTFSTNHPDIFCFSV